MTPPQDVGQVLLVRVHKAPPALSRALAPLAGDAWFCRWLQLTPHGAAPLCFPCYQWLEGEGSLVLREGTGDGHTGKGRAGVLGKRAREDRKDEPVSPRRKDRGTGLGGGAEGEVGGRGRWQSRVGEAILLRARDLVRGESSGGGSG